MALGNEYSAEVITADGTKILENGLIQFLDSTNQPSPNTSTITSGALPTLSAWVSGTAQQNPVTRGIQVALALTGDATNNAATVLVALSPDNTTYTTLYTWSLAAAVNNTGAITNVVNVGLPQSWYMKLTIGAHAAVATSVYY